MNERLTADELEQLLTVARHAVRVAVLDHCADHPDVADYPAALGEPGAVFVTLRRNGHLRGCIGTLEAFAPLVEAVADRARAAALHDPRFEPVEPRELDDLEVSVSVLSTPVPLEVASYDDLRGQLRPGLDGVVVDAGAHRATFLPSVWEEVPDREAFLLALWRKAGLPAHAWPPGIRLARYTAQHAPGP
jgi:AmmeMemoRadiSam system protein A